MEKRLGLKIYASLKVTHKREDLMVVEVGGKARLQLLLLPRKCPKMSGCVAWVPHPYLPPLPHLSLSRFP